tara:strand:- start:120 stop:362 length:243 start_codon:yes stop_codon:yes gene_type:complete
LLDNIGIEFIKNNRNPIRKKATIALLIRSISIPSFNKRPITLKGMPYLISVLAITSDNFGSFFPRKKPNVKKGIIFTKRE